ncbi:MAG: hypothetical protein L3J71_18195 [Victivallaceae bacterium]|nr:hypothetical protein [Victivallaceae bacterium]
MQLEHLGNDIFEELVNMPVIDAHEHLLTENLLIPQNLDFSILFVEYCREF